MAPLPARPSPRASARSSFDRGRLASSRVPPRSSTSIRPPGPGASARCSLRSRCCSGTQRSHRTWAKGLQLLSLGRDGACLPAAEVLVKATPRVARAPKGLPSAVLVAPSEAHFQVLEGEPSLVSQFQAEAAPPCAASAGPARRASCGSSRTRACACHRCNRRFNTSAASCRGCSGPQAGRLTRCRARAPGPSTRSD